jgi:hypothetical protein
LGNSRSFKVLGVVILFLSLTASFAVSANSESEKALVFGYDGVTSKMTLDFLRGQSGLDVAFYDVSIGDLKAKMVDVLQLLQISGVTIIPPDVCLPCAMQGRTMDEVLVDFSSPTVGFFRAGVLTAVSIGIIDSKHLSEALSVASGSVQVFTYSGRTQGYEPCEEVGNVLSRRKWNLQLRRGGKRACSAHNVLGCDGFGESMYLHGVHGVAVDYVAVGGEGQDFDGRPLFHLCRVCWVLRSWSCRHLIFRHVSGCW